MNPNIGKEAHKSAAARSEIGKFKVSLNSYKGKDSNTWRARHQAIPQDIKDIYEWCKGYSTKELDVLKELKDIYIAMKTNLLEGELAKKIKSGDKFTAGERDQLRILIDLLEKHHKLKYGEKKLNINASYKDIRDMMFPDEK